MAKTSGEKKSTIKKLVGDSNLLSKTKYNILNNIGLQRILLALVVLIILIIITTPKFISEIKIKEAGEVADSDIISPVKFPVYKDEDTFNKEKEELIKKVRPYYYIDNDITDIAISQIHPFFDSALTLINSKGLYQAINSEGMQLPPTTWRLIANKENRKKLEGYVTSLTRKIMDNGIIKNKTQLQEKGIENITVQKNSKEIDTPVDKIVSKNTVEPIIKKKAEEVIPEEDKNFLESTVLLTKMMIKPNLIEDKTITNERRRDALSQISPVKYWILEGEKIISAHTRITEEQINIIEALNENLTIGRIVLLWIGKSFLILILTSILGSYIYFFHRDIFNNIKSLVVISIIFLSIIGIGKLLIYIFSDQLPQSGLIFPAATISILITMLFNMELGLITALISGLIAGILCGFDITVALVTIIGSSVGALSANKVTTRRVLIYTGLLIILTSILIILGTELISLSPTNEIIYNLFWGSGGALLSIVLASILLPPTEYIFNISSKLRLLKFSDLNSPLLRKFASRAPGTYHHSIQVAMIAESSASAINYNSTLCRIGAYYHDIGKMLTPEFFIENQDPSENPHENLTPHFSAMIIKKHIKDGVDIAREYKIPEPIIDIIKEHHGTSLITFFYQKALQDKKNEFIDTSEYSYGGPKPKSKASAIIMLADSAESAVRSLSNPSKSNIRNTVSTIVDNRIEEDQFDECDITLKEIEIIRRTIIKELSSIYHKRIPYSEDEDTNGKDIKRIIKDARSYTYRIYPNKD
jgi:hypothetical protein